MKQTIVKTRICSNCYMEETKNVYHMDMGKACCDYPCNFRGGGSHSGCASESERYGVYSENIKTVLKGSAENLKNGKKKITLVPMYLAEVQAEEREEKKTKTMTIYLAVINKK